MSSPGDLPDPGIESTSLTSPALAGRIFSTGAAPYIALHTRLERLCMTRRMQNQKPNQNKTRNTQEWGSGFHCVCSTWGWSREKWIAEVPQRSLNAAVPEYRPTFSRYFQCVKRSQKLNFIVKSNFQKVTNPNFLVAKCPSLAASCSRALYKSEGNLASLARWPQTFVLCLLDSLCPRWLVQWLNVSTVF